MAKLYFRYGVMGSSKTANALMVHYNYAERGQRALLAKPSVDRRDGGHVIRSRMGLEHPCVYFHEIDDAMVKEYDCVIVDEAQFLTKAEVQYLAHVVDDLGIPVICYGLRADFRGDLFPGSQELLAISDIIEEVKTICWCGKKATYNARFDENGVVLKEGEQVVLGAGEKYVGLCRKHWAEGNMGNKPK
ncbi:thymidine kinase [Papillibacter cinnamivorans]|uniref:Thymidine kinase n=1 Tax=Papillibacter cinnamivorans DSM 12816 TaxID=1122930 RepID=A0A1W2A7B5_9FIRM|nr:thymidine kinase [Papillibacter cinnamivorans]SMC56168.1 thymidine kinase [Papillibacter cinnamivorans DSM 12816]